MLTRRTLLSSTSMAAAMMIMPRAGFSDTSAAAGEIEMRAIPSTGREDTCHRHGYVRQL